MEDTSAVTWQTRASTHPIRGAYTLNPFNANPPAKKVVLIKINTTALF